MQDIPEDVRRGLLRRHGDFTIAYSAAFQPDLAHFGDARGFLSYKMVGKTAFVLADPIAPAECVEPLVDAFLAEKKDVCFWQVSHRLAAVLAARRFFVNAFGCEPVVNLIDFSFAGPQKRSFRTAQNRLSAAGYSLAEVPVGALDATAVRAVSDGWRRTKVTKRRELGFLVRPAILTDEPDVRKFFMLDSKGEPAGFAFFDPVYENGTLAGYLSATRRWLPEADPLSGYFMMRGAIERFQTEGVRHLHLGLSPFHRIEDGEFEKNWVTRRVFRLIYTNGLINRYIYPVRSVSEHKELYGGTSPQCYYAFNTLPAIPRILKLMRACRII